MTAHPGIPKEIPPGGRNQLIRKEMLGGEGHAVPLPPLLKYREMYMHNTHQTRMDTGGERGLGFAKRPL